MLERGEHDAHQRARDAGVLDSRGPVAGEDPEDDRDDAEAPAIGATTAMAPIAMPAVVGVQAERSRDRGRDREQHRWVVAAPRRARRPTTATAVSPATCAQNMTRSAPSVRPCHGPTKSATPQARLAPSASSRPFTRRTGGGARVELVRVVQDGRLGGAGCARVVVSRDAVQQLRPLAGREPFGALLDQA